MPALADQPDPAQWATLWRQARRRSGYTYLALATRADLSERTAYTALRDGHCSATTAIRLCHALGITVSLPQASHG